MHPLNPIKRLSIGLLLVLAGMGCHKKDNGDYPVTNEIRDLYLFRPGSSWTMKDALTGRVDSFYVAGFDSISSQSPNRNGRTEELYITIREVNADHSNVADSASYTLHLVGGTAGLTYRDYIFKEEGNCPAIGSAIVWHDTFQSNGQSYTHVAESAVVWLMTVNGITDTNLAYLNSYFIDHEHGIIKIGFVSKYHRFDWELIQAHIIR